MYIFVSVVNLLRISINQ